MKEPSPSRAIWISIAALVFMTALAFVVSADNAVTRADADVVSWVADRRSPLVVDLGHAASLLGNILVIGPLALVAAAIVSYSRGRSPAVSLPALALALAAISNPLIKLAVGRPRPAAELAEVVESSSGYPSGHSAQSAAFWIGLALLIALRSDHPRRWIVAGAAVAFVVGLSRIVLSVHSPTDLLGGWALGLACVLLSGSALGVWRTRHHQRDAVEPAVGTASPGSALENDEGPAVARP